LVGSESGGGARETGVGFAKAAEEPLEPLLGRIVGHGGVEDERVTARGREDEDARIFKLRNEFEGILDGGTTTTTDEDWIRSIVCIA
jgi:hypothetical protein